MLFTITLPPVEKKHFKYMCMSSPIASGPASQKFTASARSSDTEYAEHGIVIGDPGYMFDMTPIDQNMSATRTESGTLFAFLHLVSALS